MSILGQMGNADEKLVFFDVPNFTIDLKGVKSVIIISTGNGKARITVKLWALALVGRCLRSLFFVGKLCRKKRCQQD